MAPATPSQVSAISVMRLSGPDAIAIADRIWKGKKLGKAASHTAHFGTVLDTQGRELDQAVVTIYRAPHSYTGEDSVEISTHGSLYVRQELLQSLLQAGAVTAQPGEFTRRAFLNGRMDLTQAEAVADIIASESRAAHKVALSQLRGDFSKRLDQLRRSLLEMATLLELELDFSEEDVEFADRSKLLTLAKDIKQEVDRLANSFSAGDAIKNGITTAIVGPANAGKSSLLNALLGHDRAIVSPIAGTTRDTVEATLHLGDHLFRFIDTAGLRATSDPIEQIGIERTHTAGSQASLILFVADATLPFPAESLRTLEQTLNTDHPSILILLNKSDITEKSPLTDESALIEKSGLTNNSAITDNSDAIRTSDHVAFVTSPYPPYPALTISATGGQGLDTLRQYLTRHADALTANTGDILITNARHQQALQHASATLTDLLTALHNVLPADLIAQHLRATLSHLSTLTGTIPSTEILATIFSRFCIGK